MANKNKINSLELIEKKTIYSKYGENLNRIFKSRSLRSLIYELKNPKKFLPNQWAEAQEFNIKKKPKRNNEENYTDIFNSMQNYLQKEKKKENHKIISPNKIKIKNERDIIDKNGFMDPFKYNPNYNAISKNIPSVKMILTDKEKREMKKKEESLKRNKQLKLVHSKTESGDKKNKILLDIVDENNTSRNSSPKSKNNELPMITNVPKQKERSITVQNENKKKNINMKNNHAMRFSKYLSRKTNFTDRNVDNRMSYLEPYKYLDNKTKVIDFRKMSSRKPRDFINKAILENPSFNNYNPKFDLVEKKMAQVDFSPHINKKNSKKYLLKKLWGSYDVKADYQLVDNNKLRNTHSIDN
jgi:hypothetical protein